MSNNKPSSGFGGLNTTSRHLPSKSALPDIGGGGGSSSSTDLKQNGLAQPYQPHKTSPPSTLRRSSTDEAGPHGPTSTSTSTATAAPRKTRNRAKSLRKSALRRMYLDSHHPAHATADEEELDSDAAASSLLMMRDRYAASSTASSVVATVDYADTAWWGWVLLLTTWFVFVVGMGSVLGVWDWAWSAVEAEALALAMGSNDTDNPLVWLGSNEDYGLPVPGYYPSLVILTGVIAWVWVIVAWVGMKYFRHAKIQSGD